jgi:hypothetical protein
MSANEFYSSGNQGQYQGGGNEQDYQNQQQQQQQPQEGESGDRGLLAVCTMEIELVWGYFFINKFRLWVEDFQVDTWEAKLVAIIQLWARLLVPLVVPLLLIKLKIYGKIVKNTNIKVRACFLAAMMVNEMSIVVMKEETITEEMIIEAMKEEMITEEMIMEEIIMEEMISEEMRKEMITEEMTMVEVIIEEMNIVRCNRPKLMIDRF